MNNKYKRILIIIICGALLISTFHFSKWGFMPSGTYRNNRGDKVLDAVLEAHVKHLSYEIPKKSKSGYDRINITAEYIISEFKKAGYTPEIQEYKINSMKYQNIFVTKKGLTNKILVIGAHYDTYMNPGADDNMSGVAVLLETAKLSANIETTDTIVFVAFANEEPPNFQTDDMGSYVFAKGLKEKKTDVSGAIILECVGYYSEAFGSQTYPPLFGLFYPNKGNFITVVSNFNSKKLAASVEKKFKSVTSLPVSKAVTFDFVPGVDFSDNWGFWKEGYSSIILTDTAFYRNPNYHTSKDVYGELDYERMAEIVETLAKYIDPDSDRH